jgi:transposase InsO family protein
VENHIGKDINLLRSNNRSEYTSNEFKKLCKEEGIKREMIVPFNPQQNWVAERKSQTIIEVVKEMLHDQDLPVRNNRCARLTTENIAILSPNNTLKPPPRTLTLTENSYGSKP